MQILNILGRKVGFEGHCTEFPPRELWRILHQAMVDGMPLFGTRVDICERGKLPETRRQREEKIR